MPRRRARHGRAEARAWLAGLRTSHSYGFVLLLVVVSFLFMAAAPDASWVPGVLVVIECGTLLVALWTSRAGPMRLRLAVIAVAVAVAVAQLVSDDKTLTGLSGLLSGLLVVAIIGVTGRGVVNQGVVNAQSVIGAICIYLLLGMLFVFAYTVLAVLGSGPLFVQGTDGTLPLRLYFSFVTLTTVGYGDYTLNGNLGHTLAVTEALLGQLYLVTVVAVLVSRMGTRRSPPPSGGAPA